MTLFEEIKTSLEDAIDFESKIELTQECISNLQPFEDKVTNYDFIKKMSIFELAKFLDCYGRFEDSPWMKWFDEKYCENCESVKCKYEGDMWNADHEFEAAYCELADESGIKRCRFFPDMNDVPDSKQTCLMWLKEEKK